MKTPRPVRSQTLPDRLPVDPPPSEMLLRPSHVPRASSQQSDSAVGLDSTSRAESTASPRRKKGPELTRQSRLDDTMCSPPGRDEECADSKSQTTVTASSSDGQEAVSRSVTIDKPAVSGDENMLVDNSNINSKSMEKEGITDEVIDVELPAKLHVRYDL